MYGDRYEMFSGNIDPQDINQGALASCYFLCALMGLAEYDQRIKSLFITDNVNSKGVYAVKLLIQGEERIVTVDDCFPCKAKDKLPAFSSSKYAELWLLVLEKAWAKINCLCYMKTWLGTPQEALTALSKAPCIYEHHKKYIDKGSPDYIWQKIVEAFNKKYVVCTNTEEIENSEALGLVPLHAYSIIKCYEFPGSMARDVSENTIRLLKIRNPWGNKEWKGDFSSICPKWTIDLRKAVSDNEKGCRTGTFFIRYEDFIKYFQWTFFCKIEENYYYNSSKFKITRLGEMNDFATAFIQISKRTKCTFCLHQPQKRFYENLGSNYKMPIGSLIIMKYNIIGKKDTYRHIGSEFINWEKIYIEVTLSPGEYHIFAKSNWQYNITKPLELVISTYAEIPIEIYKLPNDSIPENWLEQVLLNFVKTSSNKDYFHKNEISSYSAVTINDNRNNTGYEMFYYENDSDCGTLNILLKFKKMEGIRLVNNKGTNDNEAALTIPPKSGNTIIIEYTNLPWNCKINWTHKRWFDYPPEILEKRHLKSLDTFKEKLDNDLYLYTIKHEGGYLIITNSISQCKYSVNHKFRDFTNFIFDDDIIDLETGIDYIIHPRSKKYINIKYVDKSKITELKFNTKIKII
jgi:calpain-15